MFLLVVTAVRSDALLVIKLTHIYLCTKHTIHLQAASI